MHGFNFPYTRFLISSSQTEQVLFIVVQITKQFMEGGIGWVLNTATPQKISKNNASPQGKLTKHRHRDIFSDSHD